MIPTKSMNKTSGLKRACFPIVLLFLVCALFSIVPSIPKLGRKSSEDFKELATLYRSAYLTLSEQIAERDSAVAFPDCLRHVDILLSELIKRARLLPSKDLRHDAPSSVLMESHKEGNDGKLILLRNGLIAWTNTNGKTITYQAEP